MPGSLGYAHAPLSTAELKRIDQKKEAYNLHMQLLAAINARAADPAGFDSLLEYFKLMAAFKCRYAKFITLFDEVTKREIDQVIYHGHVHVAAQKIERAEPRIKNCRIAPLYPACFGLFKSWNPVTKYIVTFSDGTELVFTNCGLNHENKLRKYRAKFDRKMDQLKADKTSMQFSYACHR